MNAWQRCVGVSVEKVVNLSAGRAWVFATLEHTVCRAGNSGACKGPVLAGSSCATCHAGNVPFPYPQTLVLRKSSQLQVNQAAQWVSAMRGDWFAGKMVLGGVVPVAPEVPG